MSSAALKKYSKDVQYLVLATYDNV